MGSLFSQAGCILLLAMLSMPPIILERPPLTILARMTCKQAGSCEEAVAMWCGGYSRADGDGDGIPCENVCHSVEQVEAIKASQGC